MDTKKYLLSLLIAVFTFLILFMLVNHYCDFSYEHQIGNEYAQEKVLRDKILKNDTIQKETLDSLFTTWDAIMRNERQQIKLEQKTAEQNLTIWLGVIAAICTILPIVIGLNQTKDIDKQLEVLEKQEELERQKASAEMDKKIIACDEKLKSLNTDLASVNTEISQSEQRLVSSKLVSFISKLSVNMKIISELEDLEIHEDVVLTCPHLLKVQLEKIEKYTKSCLDEYRSLKNSQDQNGKNSNGVTDEVKTMTLESTLDYWVMLNNLLKKFETKFSGKSLYAAHDLMDEIWNQVETLLDVNQQASLDLDTELSNAHLYAGKVKKLFLDEFGDEEEK